MVISVCLPVCLSFNHLSYSLSLSPYRYKAVMGLKWASRFCANAKFIVRVDDDVFLNVDNLIHFLKTDEGASMQVTVGCCWLLLVLVVGGIVAGVGYWWYCRCY